MSPISVFRVWVCVQEEDGVEFVGEDGLGRSEDLCGVFLGVFVL